MGNPTHLSYTKEHEWVLVEGDVATIGITKYAADALGEIVYVDLPKLGSSTTHMKICGEIESTKSVGELYAPMDGEVVGANTALSNAPDLVNSDPYGEGWLVKIKFTALPELMTASDYDALVGD
ncbi:glycine cleavage system protein GcvH [Candidatus Aquiluna sp. UB-MaderosW2red]|uniref:glycine cleavage system protein GcvH n=1 Tax=Candidatus Aquiluna sp. UB-MaderosW2red TaxID=1855377 RepID=UPI000875C921|nr:glycine cleavage system protein GcvH [Candidatus Aquiluna sp. UB-MaderosW2red]SCX03087.1 glycine cleavage system H protein [Candidatus Aquiluna sp. UB-MaderosW2red]